MTNMIEAQSAVRGLYRAQVGRVDEDGKFTARIDTGFFNNLVTNAGLDRMGYSSTWNRHCYVGTDATPPAVTDLDLGNRIASVDGVLTSGFVTRDRGTLGVPPYYTWARIVYEFAEGLAAGNLAEVGVGWDSNPTSGIFSRALIRDSEGNPTTITVLSNEVLRVTFEVRVYPSPVDATGVVTLDGQDYSYVMRPWRAGYDNQALGWHVGFYGTSAEYPAPSNTYGRVSESDQLQAWDDNNDLPLPREIPDNYSVPNEYVNGSYYRDGVVFVGLGTGNFPTGIGSIAIKMGIGAWFLQFSPKIPKGESNTLSLTLRHSWSRR